MTLLLILAVIGVVVAMAVVISKNNQKQREAAELVDAQADARHWIERLGSQVLSLNGTDEPSTRALSDASERYTAASAQMSEARSAKQARLARESALEGLHYVNAARERMGLPAGPTLPALEGQREAGAVSEDRSVEVDGQTITASPSASDETPHYYPGGRVAGRPVPAGWYSAPWWAPAAASGVWTAGSLLLFSSLFTGMAGVGPAVAAAGAADAGGDPGADGGDAGDAGDGGDAGDAGGDFGDGGGDFGGGDFGGGDFGGGFDFGGFDF